MLPTVGNISCKDDIKKVVELLQKPEITAEDVPNFNEFS